MRQNVFIPRPETFDLVALVLEEEFRIQHRLKSYSEIKHHNYLKTESFEDTQTSQIEPKLCFEVGSGTGCISISILYNLIKQRRWKENDRFLACDVNPKASHLSKINSQRILKKFSHTIHFSNENFENVFFGEAKKLDFIVSNPPYIGKFCY